MAQALKRKVTEEIFAHLNMAPFRMLFLGAPGVGKGTYAKVIAPRMNLAHLSPGEKFRASDDEAIQEFIRAGKMVPDPTVLPMMERWMEKPQCANGILLDGFPRTKEQAENWIAQGGMVDLVVRFTLPRDILIAKISGRRLCAGCGKGYNITNITGPAPYNMPPLLPKVEGKCDACGSTAPFETREDDDPAVVEQRLNAHDEWEQPLLEYFRDHHKVPFEDIPIYTGMAQVDDIYQLLAKRQKSIQDAQCKKDYFHDL